MLSTSLLFRILQNGGDTSVQQYTTCQCWLNYGSTLQINDQLHRTGWRLHYDNAQPHVTNHIRQFFAKFNITCVLHLPSSPDLAPCDFFLFPSLKPKKLWGIQFETSEAVLKSGTILKDLIKNGLRHVFGEWQQCCKMCIQLGRGVL